MKAMVFAAGLGTRLRPLTSDRPKAMVEVNGIPLLELVIRNLIRHGFTDIVVNVHHFAGTIIDFLKKKADFGINIVISDETGLLLETGGGLMKASSFFRDGSPFVVHNVDIITDLDLTEMYRRHVASGDLVTLAVRNRKTSRYFMFDKGNYLCGWKNMKTNEIRIARRPQSKLSSLAFSGIHIIDPAIFNLIEETGAFSITDVYIRLAKHYKIGCYRNDDSLWMDIGTLESLREAEKILSGRPDIA